MTSTRSKVTRKTERSYSVLYSGGRRMRPVVVSILPGDVLEFREHGRRGRWLLAIDSAFRYAVRMKALGDAAEKHRKNPKKKKVQRKGKI